MTDEERLQAEQRARKRIDDQLTQAGWIVQDLKNQALGAGRAVVEGVHALAPSAIAYVACDPVALARDLGTFRGLGWQIDALRGFDLFPHSHHFEVVALLTR